MQRDSIRPRRIYLIVSRQEFIDANYSTIACVPVYSNSNGLSSEVIVGPAEGLAHASVLRCDEVTNVEKTRLVDYVGSLGVATRRRVRRALAVALDILPEDIEDL